MDTLTGIPLPLPPLVTRPEKLPGDSKPKKKKFSNRKRVVRQEHRPDSDPYILRPNADKGIGFLGLSRKAKRQAAQGS
jgi:hypothetical protein